MTLNSRHGLGLPAWLEPCCNWLDHRSGNRYRPTCPPSSFFSSSLASDPRCYMRKPERCVFVEKLKSVFPYCAIYALQLDGSNFLGAIAMHVRKGFWGKNAGRYDRFMRKGRAAYEKMYGLIRPVVKANGAH